MSWLLYGANGYSGKLIAEKALEAGEQPVLAGRSAEKIKPIAERLGLEWVAFSTTDRETMNSVIKNSDLVLNCAGPFTKTAGPVSDACIRYGAHYLDITGEIPVFEMLHKKSAEAEKKGIILLPGTGFDIVPSDTLAAILKKELPTAEKLDLCFWGLSQPSAGTTQSALAQLPEGSLIRENGQLKRIAHFSKSRVISYEGEKHELFAIPWGDVYTANISTGIENIAVYTEIPGSDVMKMAKPLMGLLKFEPVLKSVQFMAKSLIDGPDANLRRSGHAILWGEVSDSQKSVRRALKTPEPYQLTVDTALKAVQVTLKGDTKPGFHTPTTAFGTDFFMKMPGVELREIP